MGYDYEVARKVWESHVPVEFCIDTERSVDRPFYLMIPRCSYFSLHINQITQFFSGEGGDRLDPSSMWIEYEGQPLKTYYPVGVLYDLLKPSDNDVWTVSIRVGGARPTGASMVLRDEMKSIFMQSIKEADYLKRKAEVVSSMREEDHHRLWNGVAAYRFDDFWSVNRRLMECSPEKPFLHIPIRLYQNRKAFIQKPIKPVDESGQEVVLRSALSSLLPDAELDSFRFVSHGITLPLNTPLTYLAENISYPDNFIHICAVPL